VAQACHLRKVSAEEGVIESPVDVKEGLGEVIPHTVVPRISCAPHGQQNVDCRLIVISVVERFKQDGPNQFPMRFEPSFSCITASFPAFPNPGDDLLAWLG